MDLSQLPRDLATAVGQYLGQTQAEVSSPPQATLPPSAQAAAVEDFRDTVSISESEEADAGPPRIDKRKILTQRRLDQLAAARAAKKSKGSLATRQESRHLDQARPDTDAPSNCRTTATFGRTQETQQELGEIQEQLRQQTERTQRQGEQIQQLLDAILAASGNRNARQRRRSGSPESSPCPRERIRERSPAYEPKNKNQVQIQQFRGNSAAELSTFLGTLQWVFREHPSHYRSEQRRIRLAAGHLSQTLRRDFLDNLHLKYDGSEENMSWGDMEDWLWSNINNPRGRTRTAYASLTQLKQKPTQSFRDFFRQYRTIESEFPHTVPDWLRIEMFLFCCKKSIRDLFRSQNYPQSWNDLVEKGYEYDDDVHEKQRHHDPTRGSSAMGTADAPNPIASNVVKAGIPQPGTLAQLAQLQGPHRLLSERGENWVPYQLRQDGRWLKTQMALLDQGSAYNLISPRLLTQRDWERVETTSEQPETADHTKIETRGTIHILLKATDSWGTEKIVRVSFLVSPIADEEGVWLGKPWLKHVSLLLERADQLTWTFAAPPQKASFVRGAKQIRRLTKTHFPIPIASEVNDETATHGEDTPLQEIPSAYRGWADVFSEEEAAKLPPLSGRSHPIDLEEGRIPPSGPIYNLSEHELMVLREYIASAQKKGWIRRSISPAGSPILFVPKKGGSYGYVAKLFTKLDLKDAYHRLRIRQGDEWKTAFRCHYGHYEYQVMPFGLVNAPASFQQYINDALEGLVDITCVVYLDDILIFSENAEQHEDDVKEVLSRLRKAGLYANLSKCEFSVREVSFLGFVVDQEGIHMERERVCAIAQWPVPRSVKDVQVFLGFTGFYRRFIKNYSKIVSPLSDCLRKKAPGPSILGPKAMQAFECLKTAFQNGPILKHFDPSRPIRVETDASQFAIGAIISQLHDDRWHPVAFLSRKLQDAETRYAVPDCELLAITEAFRQWRHYLAYTSQKITVLTDHLNHKYFLSKPKLTNRQVNALDQLCSFDFEIVRLSTAFHPQTDGQTERINQTIEQYLRTFCNKEQSDWMDKLPLAEFAYNTSHHDTVKAAPAEVLMGYQPRSKGHVKGRLETFSPHAMERVRGLRELHERTALLIASAQKRQAHYYNKGREPKSFQEGDWVLISTKHLPLRRPTRKLTEKYVGPYQVEQVIGDINWPIVSGCRQPSKSTTCYLSAAWNPTVVETKSLPSLKIIRLWRRARTRLSEFSITVGRKVVGDIW
ncbi:ectomycorrhiza-upregulated zf-MYND domain-containing protein [Purpureocillium lavendulum]|uniref:Ectomycorrhiza-upregulated zf-MYND domain-containing protein n=1 Tax=Purpureocillium lavendulum TaxID=1247861 RepID=A0AB34FCR5_9HYPO|nr:ectomycorrhiza-upregulated zf-MYND domain-containing protein [Purpureocillium lavendulum]